MILMCHSEIYTSECYSKVYSVLTENKLLFDHISDYSVLRKLDP